MDKELFLETYLDDLKGMRSDLASVFLQADKAQMPFLACVRLKDALEAVKRAVDVLEGLNNG